MKITYRIHLYRPIDGDAVEKWLRRMALRGWRLEKAGQLFWRFRRAEPAPLTYAVTYFPEASLYGGPPTEQQQEYAEYFAAAGWEYVDQWNRMQIFVTDWEEPIPLETDPAQKLETIRQTLKKNDRPSLLIILLSLFQIYANWKSYSIAPLTFLADPLVMVRLCAYPFLLFTSLLDLATWKLWLKKSEKSVDAGGDCAPSLFPFSRGLETGLVVLVIFFLFQGMAYALYMDVLNTVLVGCATAALIFAATFIPMWWMRERGYSEKSIRRTTLITSITTVLVFTVCVTAAIIGAEKPEPAYWYETEGRSHHYAIYNAPIPLTLSDLGIDTSQLPYSRSFFRQGGSPLLKLVQGTEDCPPEDDLEEPCYRLFYSIYHIRLPFLNSLCRRELLKQANVSPADDPRWQAEKVYTGFHDFYKAPEYLIFWENHMLFLRTDAPLSDTAINHIRSIATSYR